ncbi:MAG TPA: endo-1,4-beta-xylanase [Streptosporangiaceae bacterium]|nr:endo-1,4-beta-xylanase [Streptosporangiaceae bacterium]
MRRRSFLAAGGAAGLAATFSGLATAAPALASGAQAAGNGAQSDSLRSLAAKVGLRMGTAVMPSDLVTSAYTDILAGQFSAVTPENEMKWEVVEPTQGVFDWTGADNLVQFAEQHKQLVRGHTLLWHNQLPGWLTTGVANGTISKSQLMDLLEAHIFTEVGRYRGRIWQWDVANEFFTDSNPSGINPNDFWVSNLGTGIIPQAFRWARQADPHALLMYNDYNIAGEDGSNAKSDAVSAWVQQMLDQGVPVDGVGDQGHLDTQYGFPTKMQQDFERYASLGLKVAVTEADVRTFVDGPTTQNPTDHLAFFAQPYEFDQMMKAALAVPEVISFTVWGFSDDESWIPGFFKNPQEGYATIYDIHLNPKPAYYALQQDLQLAAFAAPQHGTS